MNDSTGSRVPPAARGLGYAGLVPLAAGAIAVWTQSDVTEINRIATAMVAYAATVLSFLGGVYWGAVLKNDDPRKTTFGLAVGIAPPLVAWVMLLMMIPGGIALGLLGTTIAYLLMLLVDYKAVRDGLAPTWYRTLRTPLTLVASVLLLIILGRIYTL